MEGAAAAFLVPACGRLFLTANTIFAVIYCKGVAEDTTTIWRGTSLAGLRALREASTRFRNYDVVLTAQVALARPRSSRPCQQSGHAHRCHGAPAAERAEEPAPRHAGRQLLRQSARLLKHDRPPLGKRPKTALCAGLPTPHWPRLKVSDFPAGSGAPRRALGGSRPINKIRRRQRHRSRRSNRGP
jgi:hypothetical protein